MPTSSAKQKLSNYHKGSKAKVDYATKYIFIKLLKNRVRINYNIIRHQCCWAQFGSVPDCNRQNIKCNATRYEYVNKS